MKSKIGSVVVTTREDAVGPVVGTRLGKPCGAVLLVGTLDGRDVLVAMSSHEASALASCMLAAAAAADGFEAPRTELGASSAEVPRA